MARRMEKLTKIRVFENFLPHDQQLEVLRVLQDPAWVLGSAPVIKGDDPPSRIWHMNFLEERPLFSETIFAKVQEALGIPVKIQRVYANGQLACQQGHMHLDDGDVTFLYYPLEDWKPEWAGNLLFFKEANVRACVSYAPNRALAFPTNLPHRAEAPSREYNGLRVSVAWKLEYD